jgi:hypothetical protein
MLAMFKKPLIEYVPVTAYSYIPWFAPTRNSSPEKVPFTIPELNTEVRIVACKLLPAIPLPLYAGIERIFSSGWLGGVR